MHDFSGGEVDGCMTDKQTQNITVLIFGAMTDLLARYWRR